MCVASPTYFAYLGILHGVGARIEAIPADRDGMRIDLLAERLEELDRAGLAERVKLVNVVGDFENPSGACLSEARRRDLMRLVRERAARQHLFVLEDAAYRELRYDGTPFVEFVEPGPRPTACDPRADVLEVFVSGFACRLRVAAGQSGSTVFDRKGNEDFGSAHLNQRIVARLLGNGAVARHAERVRAAYRVKRDAMLSALDEHLGSVEGVEWCRPDGGLYVWLSLPAGVDTRFDSPLWKRAVEGERVMYVPGDICHGGPVETRARHQMRLSFGVQDAAGIREGIARLARAIARIGAKAERRGRHRRTCMPGLGACAAPLGGTCATAPQPTGVCCAPDAMGLREGRFSFPHRFGVVKTDRNAGRRDARTRSARKKPEKLGRGCAGNPTCVSGGVWRASRAQTHVLKTRNVGNSSAKNSRGGKNAFWNGARRSHTLSARAGNGSRARVGRAPRNEEGFWGVGVRASTPCHANAGSGIALLDKPARHPAAAGTSGRSLDLLD